MSSMWLSWMRQRSSQIRKDTSYTVTWPGTVFSCETLRSHTGVDEDYALLTGEGLRTFRWNVVPSSLSVGHEDEGELTSRQGETSQMTWIFNTAVRISQPPTIVQKRRQETTNRRCVKSQKSADLIYTEFVAWNHVTVEVLRFPLSAGCFFVVMFTHMPVIPDIRKLTHNR